jgi:hypothetical protein
LRQSKSGSEISQVLTGEERRRSQRVVICVPVVVRYQRAGQTVVFQAITVSVNDHGAMLQSSRHLNSGEKIEIENERTQEKQKCKVTRAPADHPGGYLIPVEFTGSAPDFWRISFPSPHWKPLEE